MKLYTMGVCCHEGKPFVLLSPKELALVVIADVCLSFFYKYAIQELDVC